MTQSEITWMLEAVMKIGDDPHKHAFERDALCEAISRQFDVPMAMRRHYLFGDVIASFNKGALLRSIPESPLMLVNIFNADSTDDALEPYFRKKGSDENRMTAEERERAMNNLYHALKREVRK